jgi:tol-pal system-associated acyl-CoA thioesterase
MPHSFTLKVYYEDTDAGGVVYYANYLRYMERARTEYLLELGASVAELHQNGTFLVVAHVDITYKRPARLGDTLTVTTELVEAKTVKATLRQQVLRGEELLVDGLITFASINKDGRPVKLPPQITG